MKKLPLWFLGFICILGSTLGKFLGDQIMGPPQSRAEAAGRGTAQLLFIVIGAGLIVAHFVRRKR